MYPQVGNEWYNETNEISSTVITIKLINVCDLCLILLDIWVTTDCRQWVPMQPVDLTNGGVVRLVYLFKILFFKSDT